MTGTERVARAIEAGWRPACEGMAAVASWGVFRRKNDPRPYHFVDVLAGDRQVQVSISPNGRSVRVFVDGDEVS